MTGNSQRRQQSGSRLLARSSVLPIIPQLIPGEYHGQRSGQIEIVSLRQTKAALLHRIDYAAPPLISGTAIAEPQQEHRKECAVVAERET